MKQLLIIAVVAVAASSAGAAWVVHQRTLPQHCALDGSKINPVYRVTVVQPDGAACHFSGVLNARIWVERTGGEGVTVWVTDEESGEQIRSDEAHYVMSRVVTTPHTKECIHVFKEKAAAERHARAYAGRMIKNPLRIPQDLESAAAFYHPQPQQNSGQMALPSCPKICHQSPSPGPTGVEMENGLWGCGSRRLPKGFPRCPEKPPKHFS